MAHAFHSLQNFIKEEMLHPIFEIPTLSFPDEKKELCVPYETFYANYTGSEKDKTTMTCLYHAKVYQNIFCYKFNVAVLSELDDENMRQLYVADGEIRQEFNKLYTVSNNIRHRHWSLIDIPGRPLVDDVLNKIGALLLSLSYFLSHKEYRLLESIPRNTKAIGNNPVRLHERPIIRILKVDDIKTIYQKDTNKTGVVMPPHPRRSHWRELKAARYGENIGKKILIPAISVNGWEWKNSKGVLYKIV